MMKRVLFFSILLVVLSFCCFAENDTFLTEKGKKLIIHNNSSIIGYKFYSAEGINEAIKQRELYKILRSIPENEKVIKKARGWEIAGFVSLGLLGFSSGVLVTQSLKNSTDESITRLSSAGILTGILCSCASFTVHLGSISNAVDNYNLYVMGIPIK